MSGFQQKITRCARKQNILSEEANRTSESNMDMAEMLGLTDQEF